MSELEHSSALIHAFIAPARRDRYLGLLASARGRQKLRRALAHFRDLDPRTTHPLPAGWRAAAGLPQAPAVSPLDPLASDPAARRAPTNPLASPFPGALAAALADRYCVERVLGQGGMATVYLAEDLKHRRRVAVKVLHPELSAVLGPERFLQEIALTASLQHPHILPLFDSGSAEGLLYYVMPYVEGETLRARLERERQLPVLDAVRIATEVAGALQYAHGRGVVHRDVKPENVLLQNEHALVADFGIALAVQQAGGARMTQTGLSLGTPQYMSPEQAMGERALDARSDVYALGAVLYEMLAGEPPFTGPTAQAVVRPFPGDGAVTQVSADGGFEPLWSPDGRELYYRRADEVWAAALSLAPNPGVRERRLLFTGAFVAPGPLTSQNYGVAPDGGRFVMLQRLGAAQLVVVTGWIGELERRLRAR